MQDASTVAATAVMCDVVAAAVCLNPEIVTAYVLYSIVAVVVFNHGDIYIYLYIFIYFRFLPPPLLILNGVLLTFP